MSIPMARVGRSRVEPRAVVATLAVLFLLVGPAVALPTLGQYQQPRESADRVSSQSLTLLVPAVGELVDGTLIGVTMQMEATVRDGSGGVFVDTRPLTQVDMQGSARLAASTAAALSGADPREHDFFITIRSDTTAVGGPSAGAAMTTAFTALLLDLPLRDDVVMTGMINPDGSIGPVGGILQKAEAAHDAGADLFLIPQGQGVVEQVERTVTGDGWFPTVEETTTRIDVAEHAEAEWGLEVREIADVYEAVEYATDHRVARPEVPEVAVSDVFLNVMGDAAASQLAEAETAYGAARSGLDASTLQTDAPATFDSLDALLGRARERLDSANASIDAGSPYSASSLVFQANLETREVSIWLDALAADDPRAFVTDYGEGLSDRLDATSAEAANADPRAASTLEAVGAAQVRVLEARRLLVAAQSAHEDDRLADAIDALAFSEERRRSVEWWLGLAEDIRRGTGSSGSVLSADVATLASEFQGIAQEALAYAQVLIGETGATQAQARIMQEAAANLADARTAAQDGLHVGALYLAIESRVGAHTALSLVGSEDLIDQRLARQRDLALIAVQATRTAGAEPFLAVSYLDFGETLSATQPVDALLMYGNAAAIAATSGALASGDECGFAGVPCRSTVPDVTRVRVPGPDPWTAYFALATVLLGFMAGLLVALVGTAAQRRRARDADTGSPPGPGTPIAPGASPVRARRAAPARHAVLAAGNGQARPVRRAAVRHPSPAAPVGGVPRRPRHVATSNPK